MCKAAAYRPKVDLNIDRRFNIDRYGSRALGICMRLNASYLPYAPVVLEICIKRFLPERVGRPFAVPFPCEFHKFNDPGLNKRNEEEHQGRSTRKYCTKLCVGLEYCTAQSFVWGCTLDLGDDGPAQVVLIDSSTLFFLWIDKRNGKIDSVKQRVCLYLLYPCLVLQCMRSFQSFSGFIYEETQTGLRSFYIKKYIVIKCKVPTHPRRETGDLETPEKNRTNLNNLLRIMKRSNLRAPRLIVFFRIRRRFMPTSMKLNRKKKAGKGTQSPPPRIQVQEQHQLDPDQQRQIRCDKREQKKQIEEESEEQHDLKERGEDLSLRQNESQEREKQRRQIEEIRQQQMVSQVFSYHSSVILYLLVSRIHLNKLKIFFKTTR
jgi:hypothetical protein